MSDLLAFTVVGLVTGSVYAIAASGLVISYATSNVFNLAHGAVGMVMAFLYWELATNRGLPLLVALVLVVCVAAPLFGALLERTVMRHLASASVTVTLTVTVGLLVALIGGAQALWPPAGRRVEPFLAARELTVGQVVVSGHELLTLAVALAVAGGLYHLMVRTRTGIAMRAMVDDRGLLALHGAPSQRLGTYSWALGSALAALAGVLLVSRLQLDYITLTLLVVNAYAAAVVGRLVHLPRTIVGAMLLGLLQSYALLAIRWLPGDVVASYQGVIGGFRAAVPTIFLFAVMLALPQARLRAGGVAGARLTRAPTWPLTLVGGAALVAVVAVATAVLPTAHTARLGQALALGLIMLSLVVLTGYGGEVSLAQMTFAGLGALVVARWFGIVTPAAVVTAAVVAGAVGALVALPALRLRGLYLALGTLAFAVAMDRLVFESVELGFGTGGGVVVARPGLFGLSLDSERSFAIIVATAFAAMACLVVAVRRGRFGRLILAVRDSPAACSALGSGVTATRVGLFAVSAAMAGVAGAFYAGMNVVVGPQQFTMFQSLPLLLLAVVGGITSVSGALIGGLLLGLGTAVIQAAAPGVDGLAYLLTGLAVIAVVRLPNGLAGQLFDLPWPWRRERAAGDRSPGTPQVREEVGAGA